MPPEFFTVDELLLKAQEPLLVARLDEFMDNRGGGGEAGLYAMLARRQRWPDAGDVGSQGLHRETSALRTENRALGVHVHEDWCQIEANTVQHWARRWREQHEWLSFCSKFGFIRGMSV